MEISLAIFVEQCKSKWKKHTEIRPIWNTGQYRARLAVLQKCEQEN